ncbi:hypothetical protein KIN34_05140 [Cellulomonas sp. DKR-3]|uniref:HTTM domain-containing protein n=1 Tax=Cellulomonas fulva TaxID=2835530 RepID=A0ABS5TX34_9CELL|nr:hypothetical protein [Cellulomonas fulva]MBT0993669.1 hypothetical protein [Cellulomonas fulva]
MIARLDRLLTAPGAGFRLLEVHTLVALVIALRLVARDWAAIADRPAVLTDGLTVVAWLPPHVPAWLVVGLAVVGVGGVGLVVARTHAHAGFVVAWVAYTVLCALWGSSGKVMHNDVLTVWVGFVLLFARVPRRDEDERRTVASGWPPRAALVVLGTVYLLTGVQKLRHAGIGWALGENMSWILRQGFSPYAAGLAQWVADHDVVARGLATGAILLELTAPLWLAWRRTRALFALAVAVMHTSIWLFLGLDYSAWVLTAAAVAVPMSLPPDRRLTSLRFADLRLLVRRPALRPSSARPEAPAPGVVEPARR